MKNISSRHIVTFVVAGLILSLFCSLVISKKLSEAVSLESRARDLSVIFGAIEAGPLAIARLQSSAISQEQLSLLMSNPQLSERGLLAAKIEGGPSFGYTFADWISPTTAERLCAKTYQKIFQFPDALNPFRVSVTRDECFVVAEQKQILLYSSLATLIVASVSLLLIAISVWPVALSIRNAELAFSNGFKAIGTINFQPIKLLVREGIRNAELEREQALTTLAQQVSHDIRSPLSALQMAVKTIGNLPEEKAALIRNATCRISAIADQLLTHRKGLTQNASPRTTVAGCLDDLIREKRIEVLNRPEITIKSDFQNDSNLTIPMDKSNLTRIVSNLINNSIESIEGKGTITVGLRSTRSDISVIVSDNGKGIPSEILAKLGEQSISAGKTGGNGMGLVNARRSVESFGGTFSIQSKIQQGTIVRLSFPT